MRGILIFLAVGFFVYAGLDAQNGHYGLAVANFGIGILFSIRTLAYDEKEK
jgi:hypothetical protein